MQKRRINLSQITSSPLDKWSRERQLRAADRAAQNRAAVDLCRLQTTTTTAPPTDLNAQYEQVLAAGIFVDGTLALQVLLANTSYAAIAQLYKFRDYYALVQHDLIPTEALRGGAGGAGGAGVVLGEGVRAIRAGHDIAGHPLRRPNAQTPLYPIHPAVYVKVGCFHAQVSTRRGVLVRAMAQFALYPESRVTPTPGDMERFGVDAAFRPTGATLANPGAINLDLSEFTHAYKRVRGDRSRIDFKVVLPSVLAHERPPRASPRAPPRASPRAPPRASPRASPETVQPQE